MTSISIVIPTMNRLDSLKRTISYITKGTILPKEIIVVDQTQDLQTVEATRAFLRKLNIEHIYLHQEEPSLTKARNLGMKHVSGDLVIQMDDDVDIKTDTLAIINNIFADNDISMLAGLDEKTYHESQSMIGYLFLKKNWFKRKIGHVTLSMYGRFPSTLKSNTQTEWAMVFFSVYRTQYINKWNIKWDEKLKSYAYAEDLDFSYSYFKHSQKEKLKCIISNQVIVRHNVTQEWRIPSQKHSHMIIQHREYLRYKYHHNSILSILATNYSDFGEYLRRILYHEAPSEWIKGLIIKNKNLKSIHEGKFIY